MNMEWSWMDLSNDTKYSTTFTSNFTAENPVNNEPGLEKNRER